MKPRFSAVVLTHNRPALLEQTLASVFAQTLPFSEVIVSDNATLPEHGIKAMIEKKFPPVRLLQHPKNLGFPKGMNRGFDASTGDWVLFLADDIRLAPDFLENTAKEIGSRPSAGLFTGMITNIDGTPNFMGGSLELGSFLKMTVHKDPVPPDAPCRKIDYAAGCLMLIRRDVFEKLRGFDENIFLYYEDVDLCMRIAKLGFEIVLVPSASACHLEPGHIWKNREVMEGHDFGFYYFHFRHCSFFNLLIFLFRVFLSPGVSARIKMNGLRYMPRLIGARLGNRR